MNALEKAQLLHFAAHIKEDAREKWLGLVNTPHSPALADDVRAWWAWLDSQPDFAEKGVEVRQ
ncbi:MAG: hypothetical protein IT381_13885 [Deltaproteobacteria bacterium]|nr:hypothetical protein [Deltaproteobacteria bacterium]